MTRREWSLSRKAVVFWVAPLALVAVVPVSMMLTADTGGHGSVLHGQGTTPTDPATGSENNGTGESDHFLVGGSQLSSGKVTVGDANVTTTGTVTTSTDTTDHTSHPQTGNHGDGGAVPDIADDAFGVVVGGLHGLYPGRLLELPVTYQNPHSFAIRVISARIAASLVSSSPGVPVCSSSHLAFTPWYRRAGIVVAGHGSASSTLPVGLKVNAPDACKGARWQVTVSAQAVR